MKRTLREVAEYLGAILIGDAHSEVTGIASIRSAKTGDLVFVEDERNLQAALTSGATAVIAGEFVDRELKPKPLLLAAQPRLAFARAAAWLLRESSDSAAGVNATAQVHSSAILHKGVVVEEHVLIRENVTIGENTWLRAGCVIGDRKSVV